MPDVSRLVHSDSFGRLDDAPVQKFERGPFMNDNLIILLDGSEQFIHKSSIIAPNQHIISVDKKDESLRCRRRDDKKAII